MLIGMYINDKGISVAGSTGENPQTAVIKDSQTKEAEIFTTPLQAYVNEGMAYVGNMIKPIKQAVPKLTVDYCVLSETNEDEAILDSAGLLAVCLKKIHHDIKVFDDAKIEAVLVSIPHYFKDEQKQTIQLAFELTGLPFAGCIKAGEAIACACDFEGVPNNLMIVWGEDQVEFILMNEAQSDFVSKNLGIIQETVFQKAVLKLLVGQYEKATGNGLELVHKEQTHLEAIVKKIAQQFADPQCNLATATCYLSEVAVSLVITKKMFQQAVKPVVELVLTSIESFLKEADLKMMDLNKIAFAGQSDFFEMIIPAIEIHIDKEKIIVENPNEVLAKGTAIYLNQLIKNDKKICSEIIHNIRPEKLKAAKEIIKTTVINPGCSV